AEVPARAAEPGLDLVDDEEDAVRVGTLAQALEEGGVARDVSALTEHRLDDERRGLLRSGDGGEQVVQLAQREGGGLLLRGAVPVGGGEGGDVDPAHERAEAGGEAGARRRHRRGGDRAPVEPAVEGDDVW